MHVESNGGNGVSFLDSGIATGNTVIGNLGSGILTGSGSVVNGNTVIGNGQHGISIACPSVAIGNIAFSSFLSNFAALGPPNCQVAYIAP
jgi:hypothetical protein